MKNFIELLQRHIANTSIGPSTARGMGPKGSIQAVRKYLMKLDLSVYSKCNRPEFECQLDKITSNLKKSLPKGAQHWGSSRKFINIFLRGVLYNRYLCDKYDLYSLEPWLELPMDKHVAMGLRKEDNAENLPKWGTVIGLTPSDNKWYQEFAEETALKKETYRVHLDLLYWRGDHLTKKRVTNVKVIYLE